MVKFNILMLLYGLEQSLSQLAIKADVDLSYELTLKPEKGDLFTQIPASQRESYLRFVSMVYKITIVNTRHSRGIFTIYLFVRNAKSKYGSYTQLSSIELGYIDNKQFVSFFKKHFVGEMLNVIDLDFATFTEMRDAARTVRNILTKAIWDEIDSKILLPF